ncbi:MAG: hypothetical protein JWN30_1761 [Bacilli bacterium]|nr:hypothetical protein [Bacilli bacterium]
MQQIIYVTDKLNINNGGMCLKRLHYLDNLRVFLTMLVVVFTCFAVAYVLLKIPLTKKVL